MIDIDCVAEDRPAIFKYIVDRFGTDYTARVASFGTIQEKNSIEIICKALHKDWVDKNGEENSYNSPYSLREVENIKHLYDEDKEKAKNKYPEVFYYQDGLIGTKISQSVHPAGMIISPINLIEEYGVFEKDGELCLMMDMDEAHELGLAKYDMLVLRNVQIINDTCKNIGIPYPKTHEIDWEDKNVWNDMLKCRHSIFQFESDFSHDCLRKFKPQNIFDMSLVTACIRPSGASYRKELLSHKVHKNPSKLIDDLLKDNNGFLIYQEDTLKFLQQICGMSGSAADNVRRAIGRKDIERLEKALPSILEGYCKKSPQPKEKAEQEAKEFLQIIEDSASYQFGYNHSIAYCLLGYLCAYFRYYYPIEFITALLNNAANDDDISNGTELATRYNIKVIPPKFGHSSDKYYFNKESNEISKGVGSLKYMSEDTGNQLLQLSKNKRYVLFSDLLIDIHNETSIDSRQLTNLINIEFFSEFGNQRELMTINDMVIQFKYGEAKQMKREKVESNRFGEIILNNANCKNADGTEGKTAKLLDTKRIIRQCEAKILSLGLDDISDLVKVVNYKDATGYFGYSSGKEEDLKKLYVKDIWDLKRKSNNKIFAKGLVTQSLGSGKEARLTVYPTVYELDPIKKGDIIWCDRFTTNKDKNNKTWFTLESYRHYYG